MKLTQEKLEIVAQLRNQINDITDWENPATDSDMHTGNMLYRQFGQYLMTGEAGSLFETDIVVANKYIAGFAI